jgi:hypothetical protein
LQPPPPPPLSNDLFCITQARLAQNSYKVKVELNDETTDFDLPQKTCAENKSANLSNFGVAFYIFVV